MKEQLASTLLEHMDLPKEYARKQYESLLKQYNLCSDSLTLEQLREVLADHLQNVLLELKEKGDCA